MKRTVFIILALFIAHWLHAQKDTIKNLVFEGAGIRGIAYSGAIMQLEKDSLMKYVCRVGGTSAGAITALTLSLGYSATEITNIINNTSFNKFNDGKWGFVGGINRLKKYFGWYRGMCFETWLSNIIAAKTGNPNITFLQLHEQGYKDLYVTGTNLTSQKLMVFSYENFPNMQVKDAVRISMSIPFYFEAVFMDSAGNIHSQPQNKTGLNVMVDGGFTGNFPIRIFDSTKYLGAVETNSFLYNPQTLGFRIDSEVQIEYDYTNSGLAMRPVRNFKEYAQAFYTIIIENLNRQTLTENDWERTVSISDAGIASKIRKLSQIEVKALSENGEKAVTNYFADKP